MSRVNECQCAEKNVLSRRQTDCVRLVAHGLSDQQIANRLGVKRKVVDTHLYRAREKWNVHNRVEMTLQAIFRGLVTLEELRP